MDAIIYYSYFVCIAEEDRRRVHILLRWRSSMVEVPAESAQQNAAVSDWKRLTRKKSSATHHFVFALKLRYEQ